MVLIYAGIAPRSSQIDNELVISSKILLTKLTREKATVVLPTICVSEMLVPVEHDRHGTLLMQLQSLFLCYPFDIRASSIAAELFKQHRAMNEAERYRDRILLKADVMIVATAASAGATDFYSNDIGCRRLAGFVSNAHELPANDPNDMFLRGDLERGDPV